MARNHARFAARAAGGAIAAAGVGLLVLAGPAQAAGPTSSASTTANVTVTSSITLTLNQASFTLNGPAGTTPSAAGAVTGTVTTNDQNGYTVSVQSGGATMTGTGANTDTIPIANLQVSPNGANTWSALSNSTPVQLISTTAKSGASGDNFSQDYKVAIPATVNADTYSATLNYTAAAK